MLGKTNNPLLQQTEQALAAKVPPQLQHAFQRVVTAGLTIMYAPQSHGIMVAQLTKPGDPASNVAEGAVKLVGELYRQSRGSLPIPVMVPATMLFLCEGLGFMEQAGQVQVSAPLLAQATQDAGHFLMILLGVSQQQMHRVIARGAARRDRIAQHGPVVQQGPMVQQGPAARSASGSGGIIGNAMRGAQA